jgi:hypothetical protein
VTVPAPTSSSSPSSSTETTGAPTTTDLTAPTTGDVTTEPATVDPSTLPDPRGQYVVGITDRELTLNPGGLRYVDLDSGTIAAQTDGAEIRYPFGGFGNSPGMQFQTSRVAGSANPKITPGECAERVQTAPIDQGVTPAKDQVFCVVTDGRGATGDAIRVKIAVVTIRNVDRTGAITLSVSNWEAP